MRAAHGVIRAAAAGLLLGAVAGCSTLPRITRPIVPGDLPPRAEVEQVPFFPQERYYCGPAALATTLAWSGLAVTPDALVAQVYTPGREGSLRSDVLAAARRHGRLAVPVTTLPDLLRELAAGHPVLVFQNLALGWFPQWHFAVAVGYDLDTGEIFLRSGTEARRVTALPTFERTWARGDRWALVVLPPGVLPATGSEGDAVGAAVGLERAGRVAEAAAAYAAIVRHRPGSYAGLVGLGNARYRLRAFAGAEEAFRRAIEQRPRDPAAWNNLAHALASQGRRAEAVEAAREAVRLGGEDVDTYRATLREISAD